MLFSFGRIPYVDSGLTRERNIPEENGDVSPPINIYNFCIIKTFQF